MNGLIWYIDKKRTKCVRKKKQSTRHKNKLPMLNFIEDCITGLSKMWPNN